LSRGERGEKNGCLLVGFGGRRREYWCWRGVGGGEEERKEKESGRREKKKKKKGPCDF